MAKGGDDGKDREAELIERAVKAEAKVAAEKKAHEAMLATAANPAQTLELERAAATKQIGELKDELPAAPLKCRNCCGNLGNLGQLGHRTDSVRLLVRTVCSGGLTVFENLENDREALRTSPTLPAPAELSDMDLDEVAAGAVKSPGGVGGPASGLGVRPGVGVGAPGLGLNRGVG